MTQPSMPSIAAANTSLFKLEYPQSVGIYGTYEDAQRAVDHLADNKFPVANLAIVGTDLKLMERVTGRRSWGSVLSQGVMSGISTGLMVGLFILILSPSNNFFVQLLLALAIGITIGVVFAALGYAMSRGRRDFTSVSQTVANKYEILCEHKVAPQARDLLVQVPGARAAQFDPARAPQPQQQQWQQTGYPQAQGQPPYAQPGSGQAPYGQAPYGQQPQGQPPYGQQPYGQQPYGQAPYGQGYAPQAFQPDRGEDPSPQREDVHGQGGQGQDRS